MNYKNIFVLYSRLAEITEKCINSSKTPAGSHATCLVISRICVFSQKTGVCSTKMALDALIISLIVCIKFLN